MRTPSNVIRSGRRPSASPALSMIPLPSDGSRPALTPAIIRWMYRARASLADDGKPTTYVQIANTLEINHVPTPGHAFGRGGTWTGNKVRELVKNPVYKGSRKARIPVFAWERRAGFDYGGGGTIEIDLHDESWRMVDDGLWEAAQCAPRDTRRNRKPAAPYLLSRKVRCNNCGQIMKVEGKDGQHTYFCRSFPLQDACRKLRFDVGALDRLALGLISDAIGIETETAFQQEQLNRARVDYAARWSARRQREEEIESLRRQTRANLRMARENEGTALQRTLLLEVAEWAEAIEQGEEELAKPPPSHPDDAIVAAATSARAALERLIAESKDGVFHPRDAEGVECLRVLAEAIDQVDVAPSQNGRFDVTISMSGKPWVMEARGPTMSFAGRIVTTGLMREEEILREATSALESGRLRPSEELLAKLDLPEAALRFPQQLDKVLEALALALMLRISPSEATYYMNAGQTFRSKLTRYWWTEECCALVKTLVDLHHIEIDEKSVRLKSGWKPTFSEELARVGHQIRKYPPADISTGETAVSDADWEFLVNAGLVLSSGQLKGGNSRYDRKSLDAMLYVIRNNCRFSDLPHHMGSKPVLQTFKRSLDRSGATAALTRALLASRGIDVPADEVIPPLLSARAEASTKKMMRTKASLAKGRRRPHAKDVVTG